MTAETLLADAECRGIVLSADGDKLIVDAPVGVLTAELRERLRQHKAALIARLAASGVEPKLPLATAPQPVPVPSDRETDWISAVGALLVNAVQQGRIDADRYWDLCATFDERAAIAEYCGNLSRADAERVAFAEVWQTVERAR